MTPLEAIRAFCKTCVEPKDIRDCSGDRILNGTLKGKPCPFYPYRLGKGRPSVKVIRKHCLYCMGGRSDWVRECQSHECPLWKFRMGKNPNIRFSEERLLKHQESIKKARNALLHQKKSPKFGRKDLGL